jgi:hypothetical protein
MPFNRCWWSRRRLLTGFPKKGVASQLKIPQLPNIIEIKLSFCLSSSPKEWLLQIKPQYLPYYCRKITITEIGTFNLLSFCGAAVSQNQKSLFQLEQTVWCWALNPIPIKYQYWALLTKPKDTKRKVRCVTKTCLFNWTKTQKCPGNSKKAVK